MTGTTRRRRPTNRSVTPETALDLFARAGACCEMCGRDLAHTEEYSKHHRRPRGMGGSKVEWINDVSNLLLLCGTGTTGCHGLVESNRAEAYELGFLLRMGEHPGEVPVFLHGGRGWVYLTGDGCYADGAP